MESVAIGGSNNLMVEKYGQVQLSSRRLKKKKIIANVRS